MRILALLILSGCSVGLVDPTSSPQPGSGDFIGCIATPQKTQVGVPMEAGSMKARPTASVSVQPIKLGTALNIQSVSAAMNTTALERQPDYMPSPSEVHVRFRPRQLGTYEIVVEVVAVTGDRFQCSTSVTFTPFPAEPGVIYIDQDWLDAHPQQ